MSEPTDVFASPENARPASWPPWTIQLGAGIAMSLLGVFGGALTGRDDAFRVCLFFGGWFTAVGWLTARAGRSTDGQARRDRPMSG